MKNKEPILLGQVLGKLANSERLLIVDEDDQELYRGFVANLEPDILDGLMVKAIGLKTNVFKRGNPRERIPQREKQMVQESDLTAYSFSDLEFVIYQRIVLGKST